MHGLHWISTQGGIDVGPKPRLSWILPTDNKLNIGYTTKATKEKEKIIHMNPMEKKHQLLWPMLIFYNNFSMDWKLL